MLTETFLLRPPPWNGGFGSDPAEKMAFSISALVPERRLGIWTFQGGTFETWPLGNHYESLLFFSGRFSCWLLNIYLFFKVGLKHTRLISCDRDPFFPVFLFAMFEVHHFELFSKVFFTSRAESQQTISSAKICTTRVMESKIDTCCTCRLNKNLRGPPPMPPQEIRP